MIPLSTYFIVGALHDIDQSVFEYEDKNNCNIITLKAKNDLPDDDVRNNCSDSYWKQWL